MKWPASDFWTFSLEIYARPEVARICLKLQDEAGADVNILLLCLWLASRGSKALSPQDLTRLDDHVTPWRDQVILPLRQARRALAQFAGLPAAATLKTVAQQLELDAEHQAQLMLESFACDTVSAGTPGADRAKVAAISLGHYLEAVAAKQTGALADSIRLLVQQAFAAVP